MSSEALSRPAVAALERAAPRKLDFYALLADIEAKYCIDKSKVYVGGYSSGGWETYTLGCAAADVIRVLLGA